MEDTVFEKIYKVVRKIPRGKVATYGQIAALAGNPRWARVVGYALQDRKSTRLNSSHNNQSRMPSSA